MIYIILCTADEEHTCLNLCCRFQTPLPPGSSSNTKCLVHSQKWRTILWRLHTVHKQCLLAWSHSVCLKQFTWVWLWARSGIQLLWMVKQYVLSDTSKSMQGENSAVVNWNRCQDRDKLKVTTEKWDKHYNTCQWFTVSNKVIYTVNVKFCIKLCIALIIIITSNLHLYPSFLPLQSCGSNPLHYSSCKASQEIWILHPEQSGNIRNKV